MSDERPYHELTDCDVHGHEYYASAVKKNILVCRWCHAEYENEDDYAAKLTRQQEEDES